jgi:hypothetical protein
MQNILAPRFPASLFPVGYIRVFGFIERLSFAGWFNFEYVFRAFDLYLEARGQTLRPIIPPRNIHVGNIENQNTVTVSPAENNGSPNMLITQFRIFRNMFKRFFGCR